MTAIPSDRLVAPAVTVRSDRLVAPAFTFASWLLAPETFTFPSSAFDFDESKHPRDERGRFGDGGDADPAQLERLRAANGVVQRGMNVRLPDEMQAEVARLVKPPMEESEIGRHEQIGPMLIKYLAAHDNPNYPEGKGLGTHWTTDGHMAETAARAGGTGGWPILITAHVDESQLRTPGSGENNPSESEVTLKPDPITVTDVQIPEGIENGVIGRWRSVWPKGETMTAGGFVEEDHPRGPDGKFASKDDDRGSALEPGSKAERDSRQEMREKWVNGRWVMGYEERDHRERVTTREDGTRLNTQEQRITDTLMDAAHDLSNARVDLRGMDPKVQTILADRIDKFATEFPLAAARIGFVGSATPDGSGGMAWVMENLGPRNGREVDPGDGPQAMLFDTSWFGDAQKLADEAKSAGENGWHPAGTSASIIDHELGHILDRANMMGGSPPSDHMETVSPFTISGYASVSNTREAFAEAFALRQARGMDSLSPAVRNVMRDAVGTAGGNMAAAAEPLPPHTCYGYVEGTPLTAAGDWDPDKHPRNEKGEFSSGGESDADRATSAMVKALTEPDGGFTIDPRTGDTPDHGYAVAVDGHTSRTPVADFFRGPPGQEAGRQIIRDWLRDQQPYFAAHPEAHVGGWHDPETGHIVLDPSLVVEDRATAVRLGVEGDQQSIADLAAISEGRWDDAFIDTGGTGGVTEEKPLAAAGDFDEGKHPRGPDGRFSSGDDSSDAPASKNTTFVTRDDTDIDPTGVFNELARPMVSREALARAENYEPREPYPHAEDYASYADLPTDKTGEPIVPDEWEPGTAFSLSEAATEWQASYDNSSAIQTAADALLGMPNSEGFDSQSAANARELLTAMVGDGPEGAASVNALQTDVSYGATGTYVGVREFGPGELVRGFNDDDGTMARTFRDALDSGGTVSWSIASFMQASESASADRAAYFRDVGIDPPILENVGDEPLAGLNPAEAREQTAVENAAGTALKYTSDGLEGVPGEAPMLIRTDGKALSIDGAYEAVAGGTFAVQSIREATADERFVWGVSQAGIVDDDVPITVVDLHQLANVSLPDGVSVKKAA